MVALTEAGEAAFLRLRTTAIAFDAQLRSGLSDTDVARLGELLGQLAANAGSPASPRPALGRPRRRRASGLVRRPPKPASSPPTSPRRESM